VYAVEVSDHIMIAHSFKGEVFGPAQALHGATFTVAVAFMSEQLDANGIVVDIGCAIDVLKATLKRVNYKNLDEMAEFKGQNTTTEFLTRWVFDRFAEAVKAGQLGRSPREISALRVTVGESPNARAWYEAPLW
jgi:6-pyruvoyl-tetrahydropterin synthase